MNRVTRLTNVTSPLLIKATAASYLSRPAPALQDALDHYTTNSHSQCVSMHVRGGDKAQLQQLAFAQSLSRDGADAARRNEMMNRFGVGECTKR